MTMNLLSRITASLLLAASTVVAAPAMAGGTATIEASNGDDGLVTVRLEFLDAQSLRMSSPGHPEAYMVVNQGTPYNVIQFGSMPIVVDAAEMIASAGKAGDLPTSPAGTDDIRKFIALTATGQPETVAGIVGERYRLRYVDGDKRERDEEVVLSKDVLIRDLSRAMYGLGVKMSGAAGIAPPEGSQRLMQELDAKGLGLLRFGQRMRVSALDRTNPSPARFQLPAEPVSGLPSFSLE
jgi:hypothetical protein